VNADGSGQRLLTRAARNTATPAWSPNGRQIAFEDGIGGLLISVYVVNADGSGQRRLARNGRAPAWSPDGRTIAFISDSKIYLMNADGSEHRQLTKPPGGRSLAWSPDGRKLAFLRQGDCGQFCFNLWVVNSDGSGLRNLTSKLDAGALRRGAPASDPAWSPDGQMIAFVRLNNGLGSPIYVVKTDGSGLRRLTRPAALDADPTWSPDGRKIAFVSDRDPNSEIYVMNANGKGQRNLTRNRAFDADPAWSPDGRKIAFVSHRDGHYGIYVMNADGSGQRRLAQRSP
jgi:Tol biopolymer transport system component